MPTHNPTPRAAGRFYQPELDALRFFAFVGVLVHHKSNPLQLGSMKSAPHVVASALWVVHIVGAYGVELFFLLSSYLITRLLLIEVDNAKRLNVKAFYARRALRIWPLYFFFLIVCACLQSVYGQSVPTGFWFSSVLFYANWYLAQASVWMPLALLWTLSIEEQFYIVWPVLMRHGNRRTVFAIGVSTIVISQVTLTYLRLAGTSLHNPLFNNTFTEVQFFGLGALLALWAEKYPVSLSGVGRVVLFGAGLLLLGVAAMFDPLHPTLSAGLFSYNVLFILCALGVVALFRAVIGTSSRWYPKWLLYLGKISYGLYIFNLFTVFVVRIALRGRVPIWVELPVVIVVNVMLAVLANVLVEKPFLRLKRRFEVVHSRPVDTGTAA